MKARTLIIYALAILTFPVHGQSNIFQNAQGIIQDKVTFYDTEGYYIFKEEFDLSFDEKGFKKIKKQFSIPKDSMTTEDSDFPYAKILTSNYIKGESKTQSVFYISQSGPGKVRVVGFSTLCERDKNIEKEFYNAISYNIIPQSIFTPMKVDAIGFAGRFIDLGPACQWRGIRNLQCPDMGQMNWSEFSDLERAKQMIVGQRAVNASLKLGDILEEGEVNIVFEGQDVIAQKRKVKIKIPQLIMGGSNILIVYYVTAEVRGRYLSCVLSHYTDDVGAKKLPPLLSEVMILKEQ